MKEVSACQISLNKVSWEEMFDDEQELIEAMLACPVDKGIVPKGYEYIKSFQKYYANNGRLSDKQMTQLKRLAKAIYCSAKGLKVGGYFTRL